MRSEYRRPHPGRVWNRIPDEIRQAIVSLALDEPKLSPRELAFRFTDTKKYFVSERSVYRILQEEDLITGPAFNVIKAATVPPQYTSPDCSAIMAAVTSRATWRRGWVNKVWTTSAERPTIRKPRARSSVATRRSRTASCWKTTTCQAHSNRRSATSSATTITAAITKASAI